LRGHQHGGHVLELQRRGGRRQRDAELLQVVGQALRGVGHLRGLVAGAVEPDHQTETGQLVAAHALDGGDFLDAVGLGGRSEQQGGQQRAKGVDHRAGEGGGKTHGRT